MCFPRCLLALISRSTVPPAIQSQRYLFNWNHNKFQIIPDSYFHFLLYKYNLQLFLYLCPYLCLHLSPHLCSPVDPAGRCLFTEGWLHPWMSGLWRPGFCTRESNHQVTVLMMQTVMLMVMAKEHNNTHPVAFCLSTRNYTTILFAQKWGLAQNLSRLRSLQEKA